MGNQTIFSPSATTQFATSTVFVSINITPSSEQASSTIHAPIDESSSTPTPSGTQTASGLSTSAKIGIGIGAGVGGGGLLAFAIAYSVLKCQRKEKDVGDGPAGVVEAQQQLPGQSGQQDSVRCRLGQAELPASEVNRHRPSILSELEGNPVQNSSKNRPAGQSSPDATEEKR